MASRNSVLEGDSIVQLPLQVTTELIHVQIILVFSERVLDLATNGFHSKEREGYEAHQGDGEPAQNVQEGEW